MAKIKITPGMLRDRATPAQLKACGRQWHSYRGKKGTQAFMNMCLQRKLKISARKMGWR